MATSGADPFTKPLPKSKPINAQDEPLIPQSFIDAPSQRLYIISLGLLCQAIKAFDWLHSLVSEPTTSLTAKWICVDVAFCLFLKRLRIPRLNYAAAAVLLQIMVLCLMDGVLFGSVHIGVNSYSLSSSARDYYRKELSTTGRMISLRELFSGDEHLRGEHTVRMSPISTAKLNPDAQSYCLSPTSTSVLIPVLLNNTKPSNIRYSLSRLGSDKTEYLELGSRELRSIEHQREEALQLSKRSAEEEKNDADWDAEDENEPTAQQSLQASQSELSSTQSMTYIKVTKPGSVRLERVIDSMTGNMARVFQREVIVVPCPHAEFLPDGVVKGDPLRCQGAQEELFVKVRGVPPLSLRWHREVSGRREDFLIDRIEGELDGQGLATDLRVPLDMPLKVPGKHNYMLDSVIDGHGNVQSLNDAPLLSVSKSPRQTLSRSVTVLKRAAVSFLDCAPGKPKSLLVGSEAVLTIGAREYDIQDGPWDVKVQFQPSPDTGSSKKATKPWTKSYSTVPGQTQLTVPAHVPGEYRILEVNGQHCSADTLSPDICPVIRQPHPSAKIEWESIHECSGDAGVTAYLSLSGKPPFTIVYETKRNNEKPRELTRTFQGSRGEITLRPESSGNYTYTFNSISDSNYQRIRIDGPIINQVVHPLASAFFAGSGRSSINSCSGDKVEVDVELRGDGPWDLEIQVVGSTESETLTFKDLKKSRESIKVTIPKTINEEGGNFQVDLVSVRDSYGCKKSLAVPGKSVNVRRVKPTARFYSADGLRETVVLEGDEAHLPLRLQGEGPWLVKYALLEPSGPVQSAVLSSPNDVLKVRKGGMYRLLEVSDSQCPGAIIEGESDFTVSWTNRPSVKLANDTVVTYHKHNGSHVRAPICEGVTDYVDLELTGKAPYQISYNIARLNEAGGTRILEQPTISSIQPKSRIQLLTANSGRMFYEVRQVGDANYPLARNRDHLIPRHERLLFEQEVIKRPSAYFRKNSRLTHCLRDTFVPTDPYSVDDLIVLEGKPPFHIELSVKNLAASEIHRQTIETWDSSWKVNLPNYVFTSIGPHLVSIESVRDASSCPQAPPDPLQTSIWVDVAESAAIVPFDRREHFCIGDITQFQLEGIPPWTIGYKSNNKHHEQVAKQSPFSLVQQHAGPFSITSISHQQQQCKTTVDNIKFNVHALPSAQVAQGKDYFEDIHEGSQAQIIFSLVGEPPFTFTYQRSEPPTKKGAKPGKVLETHTVSGVMTHEYSIYSALEGTWTVTFISDKYCRYPPANPDGMPEKL